MYQRLGYHVQNYKEALESALQLLDRQKQVSAELRERLVKLKGTLSFINQFVAYYWVIYGNNKSLTLKEKIIFRFGFNREKTASMLLELHQRQGLEKVIREINTLAANREIKASLLTGLARSVFKKDKKDAALLALAAAIFDPQLWRFKFALFKFIDARMYGEASDIFYLFCHGILLSNYEYKKARKIIA